MALYNALDDMRRRWPRALVTWTRVLAGRISDPLVGRDVLTARFQAMVHCFVQTCLMASSTAIDA